MVMEKENWFVNIEQHREQLWWDWNRLEFLPIAQKQSTLVLVLLMKTRASVTMRRPLRLHLNIYLYEAEDRKFLSQFLRCHFKVDPCKGHLVIPWHVTRRQHGPTSLRRCQTSLRRLHRAGLSWTFSGHKCSDKVFFPLFIHEGRKLVFGGVGGGWTSNPNIRKKQSVSERRSGPFRWPSLIRTVRSFLTLSFNAHCSPACDPGNVIAFT